jgi:uncharacterized protein
VQVANPIGEISEAARRRLLAVRGEPLFLAGWERAIFIHYQAEPATLQASVPFELDLHDGRAFVSVVAFTMREMHPRFGGRTAAWLCQPIASHGLLNLRTYVQYKGEPGIYFMAEWLSNRMSVLLGPRAFGLPYRFGLLDYEHHSGELRGRVTAKEGALGYRATNARNDFVPCEPGSLTEFLLERYTAFTEYRRRKRFFRVWHEPWRQVSIDIDVPDSDLLFSTGDWWKTARQIGANYSPGVSVWMGWPHRIVS